MAATNNKLGRLLVELFLEDAGYQAGLKKAEATLNATSSAMQGFSRTLQKDVAAAFNSASTAARKLEDLAVQGNALAQVDLKLERSRQEIAGLAAASGDAALATRALAAAEEKAAAARAAIAAKMEAASEAQARAAERAALAQERASQRAAAAAARAAQEQAAMAERTAAAARRLDEMAGRGREVEQLALKLRRAKEEIAQLAVATGNHAQAARATAQAEREFAAAISARNQKAREAAAAADGMGAAAGNAAKGLKGMSGGLQSVAVQLPDVVAQMAVGTPLITIFIQQGLQILQQNLMNVKIAWGAVGSVAAAVGVIIAAGAAIYSTIANAQEAAAEAGGRLAARLKETGDRAQRAKEQVQKLNAEWARFKGTAQDLSDQVAIINGQLTEEEVATRKQIKALEDEARAGLVASSTRVQALEEQQRAAQAAMEAEGLNFKQRVKAERDLAAAKAALPDARKEFEERKALFDQAKKDAEAIGEYNRELREQGEREGEAGKAVREGTRDLKDRERVLRELMSAFREFAPPTTELERARALLSKMMGELEADPELAGALAGPIEILTKKIRLLEETADFEAMFSEIPRAKSRLDELGAAVDAVAKPVAALGVPEGLIELQLVAAQIAIEMSRTGDKTGRLAELLGRVNAEIKKIETAELDGLKQLGLDIQDGFNEILGNLEADFDAKASVVISVLSGDMAAAMDAIAPKLGKAVGKEAGGLIAKVISKILNFLSELGASRREADSKRAELGEEISMASKDAEQAKAEKDAVLAESASLQRQAAAAAGRGDMEGAREFADEAAKKREEAARIQEQIESAVSRKTDLENERQKTRGGADAIGDRSREWFVNMFGGLAELPKLIIKLPFAIAAGIVEGLVNFLVDFPDRIIEGFTGAGNTFLVRIIGKLDDLLIALLLKLPWALVKLPFQIAGALVKSFVKWWKEIGGLGGIAKSIANGVVTWWKGVWKDVKDFFTKVLTFGLGGKDGAGKKIKKGLKKAGEAVLEVFTFGQAKTSFGDTPGPVMAGARGMSASFKPFDTVIAAQDPVEVIRQALSLLGPGMMGRGAAAPTGGASGSSPVAVVRFSLGGRDVEDVLVRSGQRGEAPVIQRAVRASRGARAGTDRGSFSYYAP